MSAETSAAILAPARRSGEIAPMTYRTEMCAEVRDSERSTSERREAGKGPAARACSVRTRS
eukprot:5013352-Pleurochrysis_carterae.AAC.1